ncbi:hypothetical protein LIER_14601 [Lithospermum erythrorhizon]|uniref:Uncharacterized protein n=1 Tax=Lithospermum erythrorhizon TaxID=34254 RepID=A0AAV3Q1Z9_LITER
MVILEESGFAKQAQQSYNSPSSLLHAKSASALSDLSPNSGSLAYNPKPGPPDYTQPRPYPKYGPRPHQPIYHPNRTCQQRAQHPWIAPSHGQFRIRQLVVRLINHV